MAEHEPFDYAGRARAVNEAYAQRHGLRTPLRRKAKKRQRAIQARKVSEALAAWYMALDQAYPPGFWEAYEQLHQHGPAGTEAAIDFLLADPWFFRTGYVKAQLLRYLGKVPLTESQRQRLRQVMLVAVHGRDRREFRDYCRLARKLDAPELRLALEELIQDRDPGVRRRARWMHYFCVHGRWGPPPAA